MFSAAVNIIFLPLWRGRAGAATRFDFGVTARVHLGECLRLGAGCATCNGFGYFLEFGMALRMVRVRRARFSVSERR